MKFSNKIYLYFANPVKLALLNAMLISVAICANLYFQVFCIPTTYAMVVLGICFTNTIFYPFALKNQKALGLVGFISGITFCMYLYSILFLEGMNVWALVFIFFIIGLVTFIPHFMVLQLFWLFLVKPVSIKAKRFFLLGIGVCVISVCVVGHYFKIAINDIENFKNTNYQKLQKTYMTEKVLGMHFIYHTKFCEFDGWRPPKHDPILVIGLWLNNRLDPLPVSLENRLYLYEKNFPENDVKFDCSCGYMYSNLYHNDALWEKK